MTPEQRRAKLKKLREIEGFEGENALFAAAISSSVCPAICCNPDNPITRRRWSPTRIAHGGIDAELAELLGGNRPTSGRAAQKCSQCGQVGHSKRTCPQRR